MRKYFNLIIYMVLLLFVVGCINNGEDSKRVANILNDNSNLELNLLHDMSLNKYPDDYIIDHGFGGYGLYNKKYLLEENSEELNYQDLLYNGTILYYSVSAWPDYSRKGFYITRIDCSDHLIEIFGVTLDSSIEEIIEVLSSKNYKYTINNESSTYRIHKFDNSGISIYFKEKNENNKLINFTINAEVTNRFNVQY